MAPLFLILLAAFAGLLAPRFAAAQASNPLGECRKGSMTQRGLSGVENNTGFATVEVQIICDDVTLYADEVKWTEKLLIATGHVLVQQRGLRASADRLEWDRATQRGTFYNVDGWAQISNSMADRSAFAALETDLHFHVEKLERIGPGVYKLTNGWWSSCAQPVPRWEITSTSGTYKEGERIIARNALLRVKKIPVFYTPFIYYPLGEDERSTGFLMPTYSASQALGQGVGNAFFLVLGRSQDVTLFHNWFSKVGHAGGAEYRYASAPGSNGQILFDLLDNRASGVRTYNVRGSLNQRLGQPFHLIGRVNYASDQSTRALYQQNVFDFSSRERYLGMTIAGGRGRYRLSATAEQRDFFDGFAVANRQGRAPSINFSMSETPLGRSPIYFGVASDTTYFVQQADLAVPETDRSLLRVDLSPTIRAPLSRLSFLSVTTSATLRMTHWTKGRTVTEAGETADGPPVTRQLTDLQLRIVGPVFARIWSPTTNGYADKIKHVIEPRISVSWLSAFDRFEEVVKIDPIDQLVGNNTTIRYELVNRLLARRRAPAGAKGQVREIFMVSIAQSRYTVPLAAAFDTQEHGAVTSVGAYSPIQITATTAATDDITSRFQMYIDSTVKKVTQYSASATFGRGERQLMAGWSKRMFIPELPNYNIPELATHFFNVSVTGRSSGGRVGGTYGANYDIRTRALVQQRLVLHLNAQCCGLSLDYQTIQPGQFGTIALPSDRRFGISFSLAGLGSFSNPFGSFGDNTGRR
jgi:lipopolysaccharide assembly outer membrane protein LptD (OstA)